MFTSKFPVHCFFASLILSQIQVVEAVSISTLWYFWLGLFLLIFIAAFASGMWRRHVYLRRNRVFAPHTTTVVHTTHASGAYPARTTTTYPRTVVGPHGAPPVQPVPPGQPFAYTQPQPPPYGFNPPPSSALYTDPAYPPPAYSNPPPSYQSATAGGPGAQPADPFARAAYGDR